MTGLVTFGDLLDVTCGLHAVVTAVGRYLQDLTSGEGPVMYRSGASRSPWASACVQAPRPGLPARRARLMAVALTGQNIPRISYMVSHVKQNPDPRDSWRTAMAFGTQYLSSAWPGGFTGVPARCDRPRRKIAKRP
jgi:hypothetical protein